MTTHSQYIVHAQTRAETCPRGHSLHNAYTNPAGYLECRQCNRYRVRFMQQAAAAPLLDPDFDKDTLDDAQ